MPANRTVYAGGAPQEFEYSETAENLYKYRAYKDVTLIRFYENNYGKESQYSLTFYIYNPNRVVFANDTRNNVQIGYANTSTDVFRAKYNKYLIVKDGQSETGLFMRFKISGFNMPVDDDRFYCFSGIELVTLGKQNATEYPVSTIYECTTKDNKTTISKQTLPTVEVDVEHTQFRTDYSSKGENWRNQLSMCYFALPNNILGIGNYGTLEAVTAEFYNYFTKPVLILKDEEIYKDLISNYVGKKQSKYGFGFGIQIYKNDDTLYHDYSYGNFDEGIFVKVIEKINTLYWFFHDKIEGKEPDFDSEDYIFSGEYLRTYFYNYAEKHGRAQAILDLLISQSEYEQEKLSLSGFDYGYNKHTYSIAEKSGVEDDVFGFGLKFDDTGWFKSLLGIRESETKELLPLVKIEEEDLILSDAKFSKKYYVEESEVSNIKAYMVQQLTMRKETWILRYDSCEYYAGVASPRSDALLAQESIYLDFDILSFRYAQEDSKYTIANIGSPEDVFDDITGTKKPLSWWEKFIKWLEDLFKLIVAWGAAILFMAVGVLGLRLFFKLIRFISDVFHNWIARVTLCLSLCAVAIVLYYFYVNWVIGIIMDLGGLW